MRRLIIKEGNKYGRLTIVKEVNSKGGLRYFNCKCSCGQIINIKLTYIIHGKTKSCGCLFKDSLKNKTHGLSNTSFYRRYISMLQRCEDVRHKLYKNYGGRGIKREWKTFEEFRDDMYKGYLKHEKEFGTNQTIIYRIDVNGNYCKENCKWVTMKQQQRNRRNNRMYKGKCIAEWCEELGLNLDTIYAKIKRKNGDIGKALGIY